MPHTAVFFFDDTIPCYRHQRAKRGYVSCANGTSSYNRDMFNRPALSLTSAQDIEQLSEHIGVVNSWGYMEESAIAHGT